MKILHRLTYMAALLVLCSCTQNDGDIGIFFGTWANSGFKIDGSEVADFDTQTTTWNFQSDVIQICRNDEYHQNIRRYGTWKDSGHSLLLDFTHSEPGIAPGSNIYQAPEWLHFPQNTVIELQYVEKSGSKLVLSRTDENGTTYEYTLKKTW